MGMAEPLEPESNPAAPLKAVPPLSRADWLVGAEEGVEAQLARDTKSDSESRPVPKLFRPGASEGVDAVAAPAPTAVPVLQRPAGSVTADSGASEFAQGSAMSWEPGANSVPAMRREPARSSIPAEPTRDFPMDDAEERARTKARAAMADAAAAETVVRPHDLVTPEAFDVPAPVLPWWMHAPEALRTDRRLQLLAGLGVALLLTIAFFPRAEQGVSLADLRQRPDHFDGQDVKVRGRVGEVFQVGGGYAFYLHQGRDTMVVFTRIRTPKPRESVDITGHVSTGYLDGQPRLALFERNAPEK